MKGARQNHQEQSDWIDFGRELYIPRSRHHEFSLVKKKRQMAFFLFKKIQCLGVAIAVNDNHPYHNKIFYSKLLTSEDGQKFL